VEIQRKFFPPILAENDKVFFAHLEGVICSVDELCSLLVTKTKIAYAFRIAPSHPKYNNMIIEELLKFHNMFKIRLDMSKSIKTTGTIVFKISLDK
jgi:hypothetical protein